MCKKKKKKKKIESFVSFLLLLRGFLYLYQQIRPSALVGRGTNMSSYEPVVASAGDNDLFFADVKRRERRPTDVQINDIVSQTEHVASTATPSTFGMSVRA